MNDRIIYFDNAATTFPKPPEVAGAIVRFMNDVGGNPGRSGHRLSIEAGRIVFRAREALARLFGIDDSSRIIFTTNATEGINLALFGALEPGSHVVTTSMEHNAVMRPLRHMERNLGISVTIVPCGSDGSLEVDKLKAALRGDTKLIVVNHASNVTGTIIPAEEIGALKGSALFLVDAAQSAGVLPIDVKAMGIDLLAFTGHKSLYGPTGTGGLYIREGLNLKPLKFGGTGSSSGSEEMPDFLPDVYESGTLNAAGLAGLGAGVEFIERAGVEAIRAHEAGLTDAMLAGLRKINGVTIYGTGDSRRQTATVSIDMEGFVSSRLTEILDRTYGIMTRPGLHCAPAAHRTIGTYPCGTLRISAGYFNTLDDVSLLIDALQSISKNREELTDEA